MNFDEIIYYRRSVKHFNDTSIDSETVRNCLSNAILAPNTSNMQLWIFYHITNPEILKILSAACLNQQAATTVQQLIVFETRQDLYIKRAIKMFELETHNILKNCPKEKHEKRIKQWKLYYGTIMPFLYFRFLGIIGFFRQILVIMVGLFMSITYQVSECYMRVVVYKSCALVAQTFMLVMINERYDTCPMEGFYSKK